MYIELHARSAFSFLEGASLPEELIGVCAHFKLPAMALLDTDGVYGAPRFHLAATKRNQSPHRRGSTCHNHCHRAEHGATRSKALAKSKDPELTNHYSATFRNVAGIPCLRRNDKSVSTSSPRRIPPRLSEPLPPDHQNEVARQKRRRRSHCARTSKNTPKDSSASPAATKARSPQLCSKEASTKPAAKSINSSASSAPRMSTSNCSATFTAKKNPATAPPSISPAPLISHYSPPTASNYAIPKAANSATPSPPSATTALSRPPDACSPATPNAI